MEGLILGVAYVVAGVPHATLFGLVTALLAMVPLGATVALALVGLVLLAVNKVVAAALVVGLGAAVTFVGDHFFRPVLIGGATRLPFVWVLLGILGGVAAWGLIGLFVGPALLAAVILLWREWVGSQEGPINPRRRTRPRRSDRRRGGQMPPPASLSAASSHRGSRHGCSRASTAAAPSAGETTAASSVSSAWSGGS